MRALGIAVIASTLLVACGDDIIPTGEPGQFTISGTIQYEDRPQQTANGRLGAAAPKPARGVQVAVIDENDDETIAMTVTDDTGKFTITFDSFEGEKLHILAIASSTTAERPIAVRHASTEDIHGFGGPTFEAGTVTTADVLITESSGEAEAFNIFDVTVEVMDEIPIMFPGRNATQLTLFWHAGNDDGTYYFDNGIYLLGEVADSDGYDDTVILHEAAHWLEEAYGRTDSPGGDHDGSPTDPTLAWSEGFSTYYAMGHTGVPVYADSNSGGDGGFAYNGDTTNTKANPAGSIGQNVSEDMVTEILWDMSDAPGSDDDPLAGTHNQVMALQPFLRTATLRNVGKSGVDLVDALDGWFIQQGLTTCPGMRNILDVKHTFPYDYLSSAGTCPP